MSATDTLERAPGPPEDVQRQEDLRWFDTGRLARYETEAPSGALPTLDDWWIDLPGPRLVFVDGAFRAELSAPGEVRVTNGGTELSGNPLADRAVREARAGFAIVVGKRGVIGTVQIVYVSTGGSAHYANKIVLEEDAQASIVETHLGSGWANVANWYEAKRGARLMRAVRAVKTGGAFTDHAASCVPEAASFISTALVLGCDTARLETGNIASMPGAYVEVGGALLARGEQMLGTFNLVDHAGEEGTSRQTWRAVASERATASIAARVAVRRGAQKTDGEQSLRGLLLDRTATINLKPELEIFADDVKCAHGATVGELDRRALFYLQSRGLAEGAAKALLTRAFVADALDRIGQEPVREAFAADAEKWLGEAL
ncbi:SufD family Fe-S cluster assembly protein [Sphingosinithalassobacter sp. CS137]|uniref:SufD family Fe-S cluster assembly protein n=1 Tax=Sphingosinithalassobacter sp. CS137 TaxID=2762748 RepID=UPI0021CE3771|nr:SufD family Fe-S cluster assembly protein [Sphingosinithalassobacter sp. CS137]